MKIAPYVTVQSPIPNGIEKCLRFIFQITLQGKGLHKDQKIQEFTEHKFLAEHHHFESSLSVLSGFFDLLHHSVRLHQPSISFELA